MKQCLITKKEDNNLTKMPEGEMNFVFNKGKYGSLKLKMLFIFGSEHSF